MKNLIGGVLGKSIRDKLQLKELLIDLGQDSVISSDTLPILEAVLELSCLKARDIMLPRHQIDVIDIQDDINSIVNKVISTGHSRFPVIDGTISNVIGILHSKDLLRYMVDKDNFNFKDYIREAFFVPEIKSLDSLMYEMRIRHSHLAIIVDEFTNVVGIATLEMIVEQIIGEIEDEYDSVDGEREIVELAPNSYRLKGYCKLIQFNNITGVTWQDDVVETIGGFIIKKLGRVPVIGEAFNFDNIKFEIISADSRKIKLLNAVKITSETYDTN